MISTKILIKCIIFNLLVVISILIYLIFDQYILITKLIIVILCFHCFYLFNQSIVFFVKSIIYNLKKIPNHWGIRKGKWVFDDSYLLLQQTYNISVNFVQLVGYFISYLCTVCLHTKNHTCIFMFLLFWSILYIIIFLFWLFEAIINIFNAVPYHQSRNKGN